MNKKGILFGGILVLFGLALLLSNLGVLSVDVWSLLGPFVLIGLGAWLLWGVLSGPAPAMVEEAQVPLEGATRAEVRLEHAAGRLWVEAGDAPELLLSGHFGGGVEKRVRTHAGGLQATLSLPARAWPRLAQPWSSRGTLQWSVALNRHIPLALVVKTGASETRLDLSTLKVIDLRLEAGASSTEVTLPAAAGYTRAHIASGAASTLVIVPEGVGARIKAGGGLADTNVDPRFPRVAAGQYESPDYAIAANKVDLTVETGVGAIRIR